MLGWYLGAIFTSITLGIFHVIGIGTYGLTPIELLYSGMYIYGLYHTVWLGKPLRIPKTFEVAAIVAFASCMLIASSATIFTGSQPMVLQSFKTFSHFLYLWGFAFLAVCLPIPAEAWVKGLKIHMAVAAVVMVYGLYQLPARVFDWPLGWIEVTNVTFQRGLEDPSQVGQIALQFRNFFRATSIFSEPSALVGYATSTMVLLVVPYFRGGKLLIETRWAFWALILLCGLSIFIAFSLTGLMLTGMVMSFIVLLYRKESFKKLLVIGAIAIVLLGIADRVIEGTTSVSVVELFATRLSSVFSGSAAEAESGTIIGESMPQRMDDYVMSYRVWQESPVFGVGPGNFWQSHAGRTHSSPFPSNTFGAVASEVGLLGFLAFITLIFGVMFTMLRQERAWTAERRGEDSALELLVPVLPFRWLLIVLSALVSQYHISAIFWLDVAFLFSIQLQAKRAMGTDAGMDVYMVAQPWRDRFLTGTKGIESNGTDH